ncbi:MAG: DUF4190 domain-containing protein, partial [Deltaproteobacteria bacterium]|nr:DUF4190 domain-containing protein [Deltaproteobacteria bacterium]MBW2537126.1 DUF4190 domain-containing protein [Deltaproteobacteria bacterium]
AIVSLICGILSIFCCGFLAGIPAIITGLLARSECQKDPNVSGAGLAIAGIVMGVVSAVLTVLAFALGLVGSLVENM